MTRGRGRPKKPVPPSLENSGNQMTQIETQDQDETEESTNTENSASSSENNGSKEIEESKGTKT